MHGIGLAVVTTRRWPRRTLPNGRTFRRARRTFVRNDSMTIGNLPAPLAPPPPVPHALPPRGMAAFDPAGAEAGIDWRRLLSALLRFKWLIAGVTLAGTIAGVGATRFLSPEYSAQAKIWIDMGDRRGTDRGPSPIRPGQLLDPESWVDLLKSYVVLDQVVRDERLFLEPRSVADALVLEAFRVGDQYRPGAYRFSVDRSGQGYSLTTGDGIELERGKLGDSVGTRIGFQWAPAPGTVTPGRSAEFTVTTLRDAATRLGESLDARMDMDGNFLRVELRGPNPAHITAIVNAVAQRYVQVEADLKRTKLTELTKILGDQVQHAHDNLQNAEAALQRYREQTITLPSDRPAPAPSVAGAGALNGAIVPARDPVFAGFFDMQISREQARRDRDALERLLAQASDSGLSAEALSVVGSVQENPELSQALKELTDKQAQLRAFRYKYSDEYPPVQRLLGEIATLRRQAIPTLARALAGQLGARGAELGRRLDADSRSLKQIPARAIEEARLRRDATLAENLYTDLEKQYSEAHLAEASTVADVRVLDSAVVPRRPVKNTAPRVILLALFGSFGLAVAGAVLMDRVDPRVRYPDQVSREMGLTILGAVPHVRPRARPERNGRGRPPEDVAVVVEALRGVCLNLVYAHGAAGPFLVTVTSPGAGDGKSFLAANLGHTFAEAGHRTLLVDGDIRRGVLHRRLSARRRPGLTDFLRGEVPLEAIVQTTPYQSFSLIGCGTRAYNAPELLGSQTMSQLITTLRPSYDVILVDSPPLCAGVDPLILGTLTGNLAVVLRTGYSHRDVASAKLEVLQRLPVRLLGAILNAVPAGEAYRYYSYYLPGYEAVDEEAERTSGPNKGQPFVI
jgi:polysaccharide biosynthesis transport protein